MTIEWINCADRMPPNTDDIFIVRQWNNPKNMLRITGERIRYDLTFPNLWEWIPYTEETWNELNK